MKLNKNDIFKDYPDAVNVAQLREMLGGIGKNLAYSLLNNKIIPAKKIGKDWLIAKIHVIKYLISEEE
jgi:hypothetical protein